MVLVLGGFLLMRQASIGVLEAKNDSVSIEARQALDAAQQQLNSADLTGDPNPDKKLTELALGFANRSGGSDQYDVIIISGGQTITAGDVSPASIPDTLRTQVATSDDLLMTPTQVVYRDDTAPVAGIAAGSGLTLPGTGRYEIYFVFPLTQQVNILAVLRTAVVSTGAILVVLLTFIAALVARQVVVPIRAARRAAESLASGNLDDRMKVRGRDDLARLATSMNYMASELQKQISQLEELSRVQQRFVSDVSHELRTPLTTVRMAGRGPVRDPRGLRPDRCPVRRAAADRAGPVRGAAHRPAGDLPVRRRRGRAVAERGRPARRGGPGGRGVGPAGPQQRLRDPGARP